MAGNNLTVFQQIGRLFVGEKPRIDNEPPQSGLIKATSPEEANYKLLQARQQEYLNNQYRKLKDHYFYNAISAEATRMQAFLDYESMEFYPEIAAALDLYAEESVTLDEYGRMLKIYCDHPRMKEALENLFFHVLEINTNLQQWVRNTAKYGDNFLYLKLDSQEGITGVHQLKSSEILRVEKPFIEVFRNYRDDRNESEKTTGVKFHWTAGNEDFNYWNIAHFRLFGDDRFLPYGTSMLSKVRRVWKQLVMAEDAMLVYRTSRAPERRVFKIPVGNLNEEDVDAYVNKVMDRFKKQSVADPSNGQVDHRYYQMSVEQDFVIPVRSENSGVMIDTLPGACLALDTKIPLLDGRTLSLQEIINEWDGGNRDLWVYSCDPKTGAFAPGMVTWAGVTRKNTEVMKITLDNGEEIIATPDHKFLTRMGEKKEMKDLSVGESLMPFNKNYDAVYDNYIQEWVSIHKAVAEFFNCTLCEEVVYGEDQETKILSRRKDLRDKFELYNHKIVKIEVLTENIDTGTITVDGNEIYHNYHTFALESGIYNFNSNLSEIADLEYLQNKMLSALRIPKAFLGFAESAGDGKNLALADIRFARTINRIQQAMIQELNKIAIIHLYLLGFKDDLTDFRISLTNPSTQSDMLKIEHWQQKFTLMRDTQQDLGNGIRAVSRTWALKNILGMTDDEIRHDIEQQRIEMAVGTELTNTASVIGHTGVFDRVDALYSKKPSEMKKDGGKADDKSKGPEGPGGGGGFGGGGGSFGGGGGSFDFGGEEGTEDLGLGGEEGGEGAPEGMEGLGGPEGTSAENTPEAPEGAPEAPEPGAEPAPEEPEENKKPQENVIRRKPLILESDTPDAMDNLMEHTRKSNLVINTLVKEINKQIGDS